MSGHAAPKHSARHPIMILVATICPMPMINVSTAFYSSRRSSRLNDEQSMVETQPDDIQEHLLLGYDQDHNTALLWTHECSLEPQAHTSQASRFICIPLLHVSARDQRRMPSLDPLTALHCCVISAKTALESQLSLHHPCFALDTSNSRKSIAIARRKANECY